MKKITLPWLLSPFLALGLSLFVHPLIKSIATRWEGVCVCLMPNHRALVTIDTPGHTRTLFQAGGMGIPIATIPSQCERAGLSGPSVGFDSIHWISSGLASLARGTNDAPKIAAMLLLGSSAATWPSTALQITGFAGVAVAMGIGSYWGGHRVTEVLAENVTKMSHPEGLSANLTSSSLVLLSGTLGLPVSTTHISSSAIIGIGLLRGDASIRWRTVREMMLAWIVTVPVSAVLSCLVYFLFSKAL